MLKAYADNAGSSPSTLLALDNVWTGDNTWNGASDIFNSDVALNGITTATDLTATILRQSTSLLSGDWISTFYGFPNTFASTNNRTAVNTSFTIDTDITGITPSSTTYAVNGTTGEVVAITGSLGGGVNWTIARGQLTGIGAAAATAITAGDVWYILPYGQYPVEMADLIDGGFDADTIQFDGYAVWMPMTIKLPDPTTYAQGRKFNLAVNPDIFGGAPIDVDFDAGTFTADFTITSGFKSMFVAPTPDNTDYLLIGEF